MEIIYLLIPISLILLGGIVWILLWAVRDGQFDDLEGPAHRILMDEDKVVVRDVESEKAVGKSDQEMVDKK
jgi:cbb3-type cytochrome oxidase maturation protein